MSRLRVRTLGSLTVEIGLHSSLPMSRAGGAVVGYLITHRDRAVSRAELAETLWPECEGDRARRRLSTVLWRLKQVGGPKLPVPRIRRTEDIAFDWECGLWVDAVALDMRVRPLLRVRSEALTQAQMVRLQRAVSLYRGDYLAGIDGEWACLERERLRNLYLDGLYHLTLACAARTHWLQVLEWGRRLNGHEPLREDIHRLLMTAYASTGNRGKAIAQYRHCQRVLNVELGVEPMSETQELYRQLVRPNADRVVAPAGTGSTIAQVSRRIGRLRRVLASSRQQLDQAIESLAHVSLPPSAD